MDQTASIIASVFFAVVFCLGWFMDARDVQRDLMEALIKSMKTEPSKWEARSEVSCNFIGAHPHCIWISEGNDGRFYVRFSKSALLGDFYEEDIRVDWVWRFSLLTAMHRLYSSKRAKVEGTVGAQVITLLKHVEDTAPAKAV